MKIEIIREPCRYKIIYYGHKPAYDTLEKTLDDAIKRVSALITAEFMK